jgi:hypothetical protein
MAKLLEKHPALKKRTFSMSKQEIDFFTEFFYFCGSFLPCWIRIQPTTTDAASGSGSITLKRRPLLFLSLDLALFSPNPQLSNALTIGYAVAVYKKYSVVRDNKHLSLEYWKKFTSRQCCGSGLFIPDPGSWFLAVPDPTTATKEKGKNSLSPTFFVATKLKITLFFKRYRKNFEAIHKELNHFCPKSFHLALKNMGLGSEIRDLE